MTVTVVDDELFYKGKKLITPILHIITYAQQASPKLPNSYVLSPLSFRPN